MLSLQRKEFIMNYQKIKTRDSITFPGLGFNFCFIFLQD